MTPLKAAAEYFHHPYGEKKKSRVLYTCWIEFTLERGSNGSGFISLLATHNQTVEIS